MLFWVNTLVKNEERYLWYAVTGIIDHVDKILLWDTGSTDKTASIIKELQYRYPSKISFKEVGEVDPVHFTLVRQKMLLESKCDWVLMLDGDEVWWDEKIKEVRSVIEKRGNEIDSIVSKYYNIIGDIYHFQDENAGKYRIDGKEGNLTIRAFNRNIKGLKFEKPHGQQGLVDAKGLLIQDRDPKKKYWQTGYSYLHFTNMQRSENRTFDQKVPKRGFKLKYEIGHKFPYDFYYPECFFSDRTENIKGVWSRPDKKYYLRSLVETPLKQFKRKYFASKRSGY